MERRVTVKPGTELLWKRSKRLRISKRLKTFVLAAAVAVGVVAAPATASAATPRLSRTRVTLTVGKSTTLKLNNAPKGKAITWSSSKKAVATVTKKGRVTAKKAGNATITAKVSQKKYTCKVTVKAKAAPAEEENPGSDIVFFHEAGKNEADLKALEAIIREQNGRYGARMPVDLDDNHCYVWTDGRLTAFRYLSVFWGDPASEPPLKGTLDLSSLSELKGVQCRYNELESLNLKGLTKLNNLDCSNGTLQSLDLSTNTALADLACENNKLTKLDVSANKALKTLSCSGNAQLTEVVFGSNKGLQKMYCDNTGLTALDLGGFTSLNDLMCKGNKSLASLKLDGCTALTRVVATGCAFKSLDLSTTGVTSSDSVKVDEGVAVTLPAGK